MERLRVKNDLAQDKSRRRIENAPYDRFVFEVINRAGIITVIVLIGAARFSFSSYAIRTVLIKNDSAVFFTFVVYVGEAHKISGRHVSVGRVSCTGIILITRPFLCDGVKRSDQRFVGDLRLRVGAELDLVACGVGFFCCRGKGQPREHGEQHDQRKQYADRFLDFCLHKTFLPVIFFKYYITSKTVCVKSCTKSRFLCTSFFGGAFSAFLFCVFYPGS